MVFLLGGWGMGDSELKQHHPNHYGTSARHQFLRQHSESYDEHEISLIPLGNQVSACNGNFLYFKMLNVNEVCCVS
jgi:hypothetical protein